MHTCASGQPIRNRLSAKCSDREGAFIPLTTKPHGQQRQVSNSLKPPVFCANNGDHDTKELCTLRRVRGYSNVKYTGLEAGGEQRRVHRVYHSPTGFSNRRQSHVSAIHM